MEEMNLPEFEKDFVPAECEACKKNHDRVIEALNQHLSDMRLIVFGHFLKQKTPDGEVIK